MPKADLVLEGGGVKGIGLVGAISVLEEAGYEFVRVAGTSAGAIVGALAAADMPAADMQEVMRNLDYRRFKDEGLLDKVPLGKVLSLLFERGMYEGDELTAWLDRVLTDLDKATFAKLRQHDDDTGSATHDLAKAYRLVVMASDVSRGRLATLPWEYHTQYPNDPDAPDGGAGQRRVADAVRASMSLPFFYEPAKLPYRAGARDTFSWMVDGGMLSNFPVGVFDRTEGTPRWDTIGVKLSAKPPADEVPALQLGDDPGIFGFAKAMVATMTGFFDRQHMEDPKVVERTVFVDTTGFDTTDFGITRDRQDELFERGREAARKFLAARDEASGAPAPGGSGGGR